MEIIKREQAVEFDAFVKSHYKASFMQGSPWAGVKKNWQWRGVISRGADGKIDGDGPTHPQGARHALFPDVQPARPRV